MRKLHLLFLILFLVSPVAGCRQNSSSSTDIPEGETVRAVSALNAFAFDMYGSLATADQGNIFLSPPSIGIALSMVWTGAEGETEKEMARALHFTAPRDTCLADLRSWLAATHRPDQERTLDVANRLWGQEGFRFQPTFSQRMEQVFHGGFDTADFRNRAEEERRRINGWVEKMTHDRIVELFPAGTVQNRTRLVLANAVYFQANWKKPFKEKGTRDQEFHAPGGPVTVPTMHLSETFPVHEGKDFVILAMPYKGDELDFVVVLPHRKDGLAHLEETMTLTELDNALTQLKPRWTHVELPRMEFSRTFPLIEPLRKMGLISVFDAGQADLSGISKDERLSVDAVVHKSFLKVDEVGTEAAAASGMTFGVTSMPPAATLFRADHPFLFLIRDKETETILFMGRLVNPVR